MRRHTLDMTAGEPVRLLLGFGVPLVVTNVLQQLYNVADSAVIGQLLGTQAFASVGAAGWLYWFGLSLLIGLTQGFSVLFSQRFGADDWQGMRRALVSSVYVLAGITVLLSMVGVLLSRWVLVLINTPTNIVDGAVEYLHYLFAGLLITACYNLLAGALRAVGDSRTPLVAMLIASVINVGLNLLFVMVFGMGIPGVAVATLIAQAFASIYCVIVLRRIEVTRIPRKEWRLDKPTAAQLTGLGAPLAIRYCIMGIGTLIVQTVINSFGYFVVTGLVAAQKFTGFMEEIAAGLDGAVSAFVGQNVGAKRSDRVRKGVRVALCFAVIAAVLLAGLSLLFGEGMLRLFITDGEQIALILQYGTAYLEVIAFSLILLYVMRIFRAALEGMGDTITPMLSELAGLAVQILTIFTLPLAFGVRGAFFAEPVSWLIVSVVLVGIYLIRVRQPKLS